MFSPLYSWKITEFNNNQSLRHMIYLNLLIKSTSWYIRRVDISYSISIYLQYIILSTVYHFISHKRGVINKIRIENINPEKYERSIINYICTIHQIFSVINLRHLTKVQTCSNLYDLEPLSHFKWRLCEMFLVDIKDKSVE